MKSRKASSRTTARIKSPSSIRRPGLLESRNSPIFFRSRKQDRLSRCQPPRCIPPFPLARRRCGCPYAGNVLPVVKFAFSQILLVSKGFFCNNGRNNRILQKTWNFSSVGAAPSVYGEEGVSFDVGTISTLDPSVSSSQLCVPNVSLTGRIVGSWDDELTSPQGCDRGGRFRTLSGLGSRCGIGSGAATADQFDGVKSNYHNTL